MSKEAKYPWNKIDLPLVMAALAETKEKRMREIARICTVYEVRTDTLRKRLQYLGVRRITSSMGTDAIKNWEKQMRLLAAALHNPARLIYTIAKRAEVMQYNIRDSRTVSIQRAAEILHCHERFLRRMATDMKLLTLDAKGRVSLDELQRFYEAEGRSLLMRKNLAARVQTEKKSGNL